MSFFARSRAYAPAFRPAFGAGGLLATRAPLDGFTVEAAYSVRRVRTGATSALRVRRASDNAQQDIGFAANSDLDTAALLSFCSGTDGFVVTWYDQGGNARNLTQATAGAQPQIVTAGALTVTLNGSPGIVFDGVDDTLGVTSWASIPQPFSRTYVATRKAAAGGGRVLNNNPASTTTADFLNDATTLMINAGGAGFPSATWSNAESAVFTSVFDGAASLIRKNGTAGAAGNVGTNTLAGIHLGTVNGFINALQADIYELVIRSNASASDALTIERNEGAYYGITVA